MPLYNVLSIKQLLTSKVVSVNGNKNLHFLDDKFILICLV